MLAGISTELLAGLVSFLFTLMILSYVIGDNFLFRLAVYIFVGVSAGYAGLVVWQQVIVNKFLGPILYGDWFERSLLVIPLVFGLVFLIAVANAQARPLARPILAFTLGVGTATAIAGAVLGTLIPQTWAAITMFEFGSVSDSQLLAEKMAEAVVALAATVLTLAYFQFGIPAKNAIKGTRGAVMKIIAGLGQGFLAITFGVLFAGVFSAALTAWVNRLQFIVDFIKSIFSGQL
jgi:hypothetical protein